MLTPTHRHISIHIIKNNKNKPLNNLTTISKQAQIKFLPTFSPLPSFLTASLNSVFKKSQENITEILTDRTHATLFQDVSLLLWKYTGIEYCSARHLSGPCSCPPAHSHRRNSPSAARNPGWLEAQLCPWARDEIWEGNMNARLTICCNYNNDL